MDNGDATKVDFKLKRLTLLKSLHYQDSEEEAFNLYQMQRQANDQLTMASSVPGYAVPPLNMGHQDELERPGMNVDHSLLLDAGRPKRSFLNSLGSHIQYTPEIASNNFGVDPSNKPERPR